VRLGTREPSPFTDSGTWIDATRAVAVGDVAPGARSRVTFALAPAASVLAGEHSATFELVRDDMTAEWFGGEAVRLSFRVVAAPAQGGDGDDDGVHAPDDGEPTGGCRIGGQSRAPGDWLGGVLVGILVLLGRAGRRTR
jgi:hypothetical protein